MPGPDGPTTRSRPEDGGAKVRIRPFLPHEFEVLWANWKTLYGPVYAPPEGARASLRERFARSGTFADGRLDLAIEVAGVLIGEVGARSIPTAMPPGVFEIGVGIFESSLHGRGYGTEAVRLITARLFDHEGAGRVQASTSVTNLAMRRALEKAGFRHEGTLRGFWPGDGAREDYALYGITESDWAGRAPA